MTTIRTHADALDVLHAIAPGAMIRVREYPRTHASQMTRVNERRVEIEPRTLGSHTGIVVCEYTLPFNADEFTAYVSRRIEDALRQRRGQLAIGESYMTEGNEGMDRQRSYAVR
jgi:hypothetical protein